MSNDRLNALIRDALEIEAREARDAGALGYMARALILATMPHRRDDAALDKIMGELLYEIWWEADRGNCFSESEASLENTDRSW